MLQVLQKASVSKVVETLEVANQLMQLTRAWGLGPEHEEYNFPDFMSDLVHEVAYRDEQGAPDGNWIEFANDWQLEESDYDAVLHAMKMNGYDKTLKTW